MSSIGLSQRQLRVGEMVRHALTSLIQREPIDDVRLRGLILCICEVAMSPNLKTARVYISSLDFSGKEFAKNPINGDMVIKALTDNVKFIRGKLAPALRQMKYMPDLRFHLDTRCDYYARIDSILKLDRVVRDLDDENTKTE